MLLSRLHAFTAMLLLSAQLLPTTASRPAVDPGMRHITAQDFKALAVTAAASSLPHGNKRALLQSTTFSQDFFNILEPILIGNTGDAGNVSTPGPRMFMSLAMALATSTSSRGLSFV